ncbi:hypothetical protein H6P81_011153 [Aristolochia fimbriata]|uniref:Uncharacterized protein n=1 Tax=Aristolochia fimbriata TaxID=158543 RepID=A0AAV7EV73_ARIFI|nr:hypothetical protein H6P81_011153 [Aristolochia fimbriata]
MEASSNGVVAGSSTTAAGRVNNISGLFSFLELLMASFVNCLGFNYEYSNDDDDDDDDPRGRRLIRTGALTPMLLKRPPPRPVVKPGHGPQTNGLKLAIRRNS